MTTVRKFRVRRNPSVFSLKPTAKRVQAQLKGIRRRLKKEPKITVHNSVAGTLNDNGLAITHLSLGGGTGSNGVVLTGASAILKSIRVKGWFKSVGAANASSRMDIVLDRSPVQGTAATFDDIYYPLIGAVTTNAMIHAENKGRFKILATFRANPVTNDGQVFHFDRFIKLNHKILSVTPNSFTVDTQYKNSILTILWTDAAANEPTYSFVIQDVIMDDN